MKSNIDRLPLEDHNSHMDIWGSHTDFGLSSDEMREAVDTHLACHIGDYETAFSDEEGWSGQSREDGPPVDVLVVPPEGERQFAYVATFGCAFQPLPSEAYTDAGIQRRVEFVLAAQQKGEEDERMTALNLVANTVRQFAKLVHLNGVTVEPGETVAFSGDPKPIYDDADFCAFMFMSPRLPGPGFDRLTPANAELGEPLYYIAPVPIHKAELDFGVEYGPEALISLLMECGVTEMVDMSRPDMIMTRPDLVKSLKTKFKASRKAPRKTPELTNTRSEVKEPPKRGVFGWLLSLIGIR